MRSLPRYKGIKGNSSGRTEGRGNKAVSDGEARERVRGEKVGERNGRLGSREVQYSSARSTQLAARGPSGNRRPSAKIYTRRHTEKFFLYSEPFVLRASTVNREQPTGNKSRLDTGAGTPMEGVSKMGKCPCRTAAGR
jgi:hypothetical protein